MRIELSGHYGYGRIIKNTAPGIAMIIVTSVYSIVDGFFVSNFVGTTAFASINLIWPAVSLLCALGLMLGSGGSALVSKIIGEGNVQRAQRIFTMVVKVTLLSGVALSVLCFIFMKEIALFLGSSEGMLEYTVMYGRIVVVMVPMFMVQLEFQSFFMVAEKPHLGTVVSLICGILNIGLDALFVVGFGWGLMGAAVATSISLLFGGIFPLAYFSSKKNSTHLKFVPVERFDWGAIGKSCSNGVSEYVGSIALNVVSICYNLQLMKYIGEDGVSAYGIIMYVSFIIAAVFIGYNIGIAQIIAYNYGAGNKEELRSLFKKSLVLVGMTGLVMTVVAEVLTVPIARTLVGYSPKLVELTVYAMRIYMLCFLFAGVNMFASAWFTALNNGLISGISAFVRTLVLELGAVFILPLIFGIEGIWGSVIVSEFLSLIMSITFFSVFRNRYLC